ncbi:MAG: hypothetical protein ACREBF_03325 [Candidatus Micrarchaeales archaeon]
METLVRLDGAAESILNDLLKPGFYKTKSEVISAGILELGKMHLSNSEFEARLIVAKINRIEKRIKSGKIKLIPLSEVIKKFGTK